MNLREGTRRLALLLGVAGAIACGYISFIGLLDTVTQSENHRHFEHLENSQLVQQERKSVGGWFRVDPQTGEGLPWEQKVDKDGIKTIHWSKRNEIESIETEDGQTLYPTPAPSTWWYFLFAILPVFGFFVPWGIVRAIGWAGAGFVQPLKYRDP